MISKIGRAAIVLALCLSIGGHWAALQSVAWATMIVEYAQRCSLPEAVAQTFDGNHPCDLCKHITKAKSSEKKQKAQLIPSKPDLICTPRTIVLVPPCTVFSFARFESSAGAQMGAPPIPPPRPELI